MACVSTIPVPLTIRQGSVLARVWAVLAVAVPAIGRWLTKTATRVRQLALYAGAFGSVCYAAWQTAEPLGWLAIGISLFLAEGLTSKDQSPG